MNILFTWRILRKRAFKFSHLAGRPCSWMNTAWLAYPQELVDATADQAIELLTKHELRRDLVEHNFLVGKKFFSFEVLRERISTWLAAG